MQETSLVGFDPSKYAEQIRSKIQEEVVRIIPEEQWTQMITAEIKKFSEPQQIKSRDYPYEVKLMESPLQALIRQALETKLRAKLDTEIDSIVATTWGCGKEQVTDALARIAAAAAPQILTTMMEGLVRSALLSAKTTGML